MASVAVLGNDIVTATRCSTGRRRSRGGYTGALLARDTHLTDRLDALGNGFIGSRLGAHSPQGQYGSLGYQHLVSQLHP
jgi:hypothetical protein